MVRILGGIVILSFTASIAVSGDALKVKACDDEQTESLQKYVGGVIKNFAEAPQADPRTDQDLRDFSKKPESHSPYKSDSEVDKAVSDQVTKFYAHAMDALTAAIAHAQAKISAGLPADDDHDAGEAFRDEIGQIVSSFPVKDNYPTIQEAVAGIAALKAYDQFTEKAIPLVEKLDKELGARCNPETSFEVKSNGLDIFGSRCRDDKTISPAEVAKWAGDVAPGNCRHLITCDGMKFGDGFLPEGSTLPVLDCRKDGNTCPAIGGCAREINAGHGEVHFKQPEATK